MPPHYHFGPLKKEGKFLMHRYATGEAADAAFYETYDSQFLTRKANLLFRLYQEASSSPQQSNDDASKNERDEYRTLLATELHCTTFHQTEALIALLLAEYQDIPDWVYLTTYRSTEPKEAANAIIDGYIPIPGTSATNLRQLVKQSVYANWDLGKTKVAAAWEESVDSIMALLQIVSEQFVNGHEYNSYKHGLRVLLGTAGLAVGPNPAKLEDMHTVACLHHAMTFLQIEKHGTDYGAQLTTKEMKPEYSAEAIGCMGALLEAIRMYRLARATKKLPKELSFPVFDTIRLDRSKPMTKFGMTY